MASEKNIRRVLDSLATAPKFKVESLPYPSVYSSLIAFQKL